MSRPTVSSSESRSSPTLFFIVVTTIFSLLFSTGAFAENRVALVIGNSAYSDAPLRNPVKDAALMASTLRDLGFEVIEQLDVDQKSMKRAIREFGDQLEQGDRDTVGLFFYAGHGIQVGGINYLVPVNAEIARESDVEIEGVSAQAVLATMEYARNRLNMVIIDACRNNPYSRSFRSATRGLAKIDAPFGTLLAYATAPGEVASDGDSENSPYTSALVANIQRPGVPVEQTFKYVRRKVMSVTGNKQVPWESSSLTGDFYFKPGEQAGPGTVAASTAQIDREALFWQSIQDSTESEDFEEYLRQFPGGLFSGLAKQRVEDLTGAQAPKPVTVTETAAINMQSTGTNEAAPRAEPQAAAVRAMEQEPNNSYATANYVPEVSWVNGRIDPKGDHDWYRVTVRQHGELAINISDVAANMDINFRAWNKEKQHVTGWIAPLAAGGDANGFVDLPTAGDYYIQIADGHSDNSSADPYSLNLRFTPSVDNYEPNNTFGSAARVATTQQWRSTLLPKGDVDWYRFEIERHGELTMRASRVPENLDVNFRVWSAQKKHLSSWFAPLSRGGPTEAFFDLPAPGRYFVEVRDGSNDERSIDPIEVEFSFNPSVDEREPNNTFGRASPIAPGQSVKATLLPKNDSDWYRVDVDEQGELDIAITESPANLDINFRVWDSELRHISGWFAPLAKGGENRVIFDLPAAGSYVLEVRDGRNDARSIDPYDLGIGFTLSRDRLEPNNTFGTASPIKLGASVTGTILPKADADWYRISAGRPGELTINMTNSPVNLDLSVRVWNADRQHISGWFAPLSKGGDTQGKVAIPSTGEYFLEVRDGRNDERSVQPYTLHTSM